MPSSPRRCPATHLVADVAAQVAALGDVAQTAHQLRHARDAAGVPANLGRLGGQAKAGQRRQHQVEGLAGGSTVDGRVDERADGLEQFDDRAGPAVRHDQRQRALVLRLDVYEVDVHSVDLGLELRQRVQSRLALAPVVLGRPVAGEFLDRRQLHTPCDRSSTSSLLGQRAAAMRRRRSAIASSGISTRKGRISASSAIPLHLLRVRRAPPGTDSRAVQLAYADHQARPQQDPTRPDSSGRTR
jgi:hypothetical protein